MGLSGGAIAGIVIGACVAAVLVGLLGEAGWASAVLRCLPAARSRQRLQRQCRRPPLFDLSKLHCPPLSAYLIPTVMWQMSAQRKRQEEADRLEAGGASGRQQGLAAAPSGKGDRFFSNLVPSFVKR